MKLADTKMESGYTYQQELLLQALERVKQVDEHLTDEEFEWVMMLLILPKIKDMVRTSDDFKDFKAMKKASVH